MALGGDSRLRVSTSTQSLAYEIGELVQEVFGGRLQVDVSRGQRTPCLVLRLDRRRAG